jgi:hypothetical protein
MALITIILFGAQIAASTWWLARFRYGPAEWLWRTLTYGRAPMMRVVTQTESWMSKYGTMPATLKAALDKTGSVPLDIDPITSFGDEVK